MLKTNSLPKIWSIGRSPPLIWMRGMVFVPVVWGLAIRTMADFCSDRAQRWQARMQAKHTPGKTLGILAAKQGRTVYHLLRTKWLSEECTFHHDFAASNPRREFFDRTACSGLA